VTWEVSFTWQWLYPAAHQEVLDRFRAVAAAKGVLCATLLDTKGPEIRTAMLKDHAPIMLEAGQVIFVEAVGDDYVNFQVEWWVLKPLQTRVESVWLQRFEAKT
jgi:hypothetical protein